MKSIDRIAAYIAAHDGADRTAVSGRWHNLQIKPDLGSGELLNVGVAFVDDGNRVHLRMARDLSRLTCLYDDKVDVRSFEKLCSVIEEAYDGASWDDFRLSQLSAHAALSEGRYASGASVSDILAGFYEATVPLGRVPGDARVSRRSPARTITTAAARLSVIEHLMGRMGERAVPFIARGPWIIPGLPGQEHRVEVPIRAPGRVCASVVSLWSKDEYRRKFQLSQAGLDLDTVRAHVSGERLGLFVMRPLEEEGYSVADLNDIDEEIDQAAWQLRKIANIEIEQGEDAEALSGKLEEWLKAA